ncbi:MAG: YicC family protein [Gammaproteobacteria bacterium]|nr:YicC family protein [Gammaproteobacteria bacterium]
MIASMTAFARFESEAWIWELRSLNHRYLDLSFNVPSYVHVLEPELRLRAKEFLNRGRIEATIYHVGSDSLADSTIDMDELRSLLANAQQVHEAVNQFNGGVQASKSAERDLDVFEALRWPGVVKQELALSDAARQAICDAFSQALEMLVANRQVEGKSLQKRFENRIESIKATLKDITSHSLSQAEYIRDKLTQRIQKFEKNIDPSRIAQEVVLLAQRADIHEEVDRLNVHIEEFEGCMQRTSPQGRRLGFIVQEMARESNTLAAKLTPPDAVNLTVELKVLIDQIREQVQNIE